MRLQPPCLATESVRCDSNGPSDRYGIAPRYKLLKRASGAFVPARRCSEARRRCKKMLRSRELTRDSIDVIRCND